MARVILLIFVLYTLCSHTQTQQILLDETTGNGTWTVINGNGTYKASATVPGGIYTDLSTAGILTEDIYYHFNDIQYRWVSKENWNYSRTFDVPEDILQKKEIFLVFYGIDTIASVYLNGQHIGDTENMFVRYAFPVKSLIKAGSNNLEVQIQSSITAAQDKYDVQAKQYIVPPNCLPTEYQGECHVNFLRKMQASFAWDWGPAFPSAGIWKSLALEAFDTAILREVTVHTVDSQSNWILRIDMVLEAGSQVIEISGNFSATITTDTDKVTVSRHDTISANDLTPGYFHTSLSLEIPKTQVELWWPNGYGNQKLYPLQVLFANDGTDISTKTFKIGFRSVELVQEPVNTGTGLTFYFKVNNVPVFAKGSNWIPSHVLPEKSAEPARLEHLLESAKLANMNMLRVWGGGLYESDLFYQLADEKGILIWQDFMFACSMYPTDQNFLQSVSTEITQQVRRLQHHPSIAIWAGNNENEGALRDNWYGTASDFDRYKADYVKLYVDTIRNITLAQDVTRPFVVSSPSNGLETEQEGYVAQQPGSSYYGDIHYYNYNANGWDPNTFTITRFSSEFGYQSLPSLSTISEVSIESERSINSEFSNHREHHPNGYNELKNEIGQNLQLPDGLSDIEEYPIFIYFSQINQAMSYKTETEFYRRSRSVLTSDGRGLTMGALYWQLNDIWQAPTWASIEFNGKWKMVHYFAKDFFSPVLVSPFVSRDGVLEVDIISDKLENLESDLTVQVYQWSSLTPIHSVKTSQTVNNASVTNAFQQNLQEFLTTAGCGDSEPSKKCFLYFTLTSPNGIDISPHNFLFPQSLKDLTDFAAAKISITNINPASGSENVFEIQLETDRVAAFVWLEANNVSGYFSTNGFLMLSPTVTIEFNAQESITVEQLQKALTTVSLADFY